MRLPKKSWCRAQAAREGALATEAGAALAAQAAPLTQHAEAVLAERLAAAEAEARDARAARDAAHASAAEAALARKSAELEAHAEEILAERLAAFEAEARSVQNAREALLAAEVKAADDARAKQERLEQTRAVQQALAGELETALADARGIGVNVFQEEDDVEVPPPAPPLNTQRSGASPEEMPPRST